MTAEPPSLRARRRAAFWRKALENHQLYLMVFPALAYILVFHYGPMYGVIIAFKQYFPPLGIWNSPWVGLRNFERFLQLPSFWNILTNTLTVSLYALMAGFPAPIVLALCLHYARNQRFKRLVQTTTYAPHFISTVVLVGMLMIFLSPRTGIVNALYTSLTGRDAVFFMARPDLFKTIYVLSGIWQNAGWGSIIYLAALSSVDPSIHESAQIDGASIVKRMWFIDLPCILPTVVILLILNCGRLMSVGFEKIYLMQNALNVSASEVISTYVYKVGLIDAQYSFSAAVDLFNSVANCLLLVTVNALANRLSGSGLW